jgi:hypothetical protein
MGRFIHRANIEHYEKLLARTTDESTSADERLLSVMVRR